MILSAIYIEEHYLFNEPQIVNLGGRFNYSIESNSILKKENEDYIPNFYNEETIALVSAIVGCNGAGKSALLNSLIETINNGYGYPAALIFEDGEKNLIRNRTNVQFNFKHEVFNLTATSFYYSPYLDFKTDRNGFDLSLDNTVEKDLEKIDEIRKASERINPIQHLKMRNWIRQIEFLNSDMGQKFGEFFDLPSKNRNKITFTRYMIDIDREKDQIQFHNTPYEFRDILQFLYDKIRKEADEINKNRPKGFNIVTLQKALLKNYFLMDFICLFIIQMEKENRYLQEGFLKIDIKKFKEKHETSEAFNTFLDFLDNHFYKFGKSEFTLLPVKETKELITKVYEFIDEVEAENDRDTRNFDWSNKTIYLDHEKAIELIKLQNKFLDVVENYYKQSSEEIADLQDSRFSKIKDFINFQPSERNLSSGENAIINLFSRFHEVFKDISKANMNTINFLLLDEADLGFHPQWKKRYVSTIIDFFNVYFKQLNNRVQIIFTTHDPLTLSDILNYNVVYLYKSNGTSVILDVESKPTHSFGANISDLLADSFFINDGLIGEFARDKIQDVIEYINDEKVRHEKVWIKSPDIAKNLISQIGEPYLSDKLNDMFLEVFPAFKDDEIIKLEEKLKHLKNDSTSGK
jgi:GTPase SAR1 family protein